MTPRWPTSSAPVRGSRHELGLGRRDRRVVPNSLLLNPRVLSLRARTRVMRIRQPGPTFGMSWCSLSFERYSLNSLTLSLCDFDAIFSMSLAWVRSACSSYLRSASVRLSLGSEGFFSPSLSPAASSRGLSASLCACGSWRARGVRFPEGWARAATEGSGGRAHLLVLFLLLLDAASRGQAPASLELQAALHDVLITLARRHGDCSPTSQTGAPMGVSGEISATGCRQLGGQSTNA